MPNHLAQETSPYLLQHANNPVDWYPWGLEALTLAWTTDRPVLLSIGYSACHWCHVMAHECFEDTDTAALMNRHFVNIKVDREERPDIDQIYLTAHELLTGRSGGWPLTLFLTPNGKPFFAGTFFPKRPRYNLPAFDALLHEVGRMWTTQREKIIAHGEELVQHLAQSVLAGPRSDSSSIGSAEGENRLKDVAEHAASRFRRALMSTFDHLNGGFGTAPKFAQPAHLDALLRSALIGRDDAARDAVLLTLRHMAEGGLYDHLGGGFYRYSTDDTWTIPHFEKMLYDNGPLLRLYAQAWQMTGDPLFRQVCHETACWLMREMQAADGGYFSSLDADSEGEEGRFYLWQREQIADALGEPEFTAFAARYGLGADPNFEDRAWHLYIDSSLSAVATQLGHTDRECSTLIARARTRLFALRETRVGPARDEKILTSWNALAIDGLAYAARVFRQPQWSTSARRALTFIRDALSRDGRLLATHKDGRSHLNAYLDDYALMLGAVLEIIQGDILHPADLKFARALADTMLAQFEDPGDGGFFFTSHDHEPLVLRPKSGDDDALPAGNGAAALHLQRLGHLIGEPHYLRAAQRTLTLFAEEVKQTPQAFATLASAMTEYVTPPTLVVFTGHPATLPMLREAIDRRYLPDVVSLQLPSDVKNLPEPLQKPTESVPLAWICHGSQCLAPVGDIKAVLAALPRYTSSGQSPD